MQALTQTLPLDFRPALVRLFAITIVGYAQMFEVATATAAPPLPPSLATRLAVDGLVQRLAVAPPQQRKAIVEDIHRIAVSTIPGERNGLMYFGFDVSVKGDGSHLMKPKSYRNPALYRAIPILISMLDDAVLAKKAYHILICLQPHCPEPRRAVWEKWWKEIGVKTYNP